MMYQPREYSSSAINHVTHVMLATVVGRILLLVCCFESCVTAIL